VAGANCHFCTFKLGSAWFGIAVDRVQEVISSPSITSVPLAPHAVAGLSNLRGQIVTVIDLGVHLGIPQPSGSSSGIMVLVRGKNLLVGLLVNEIGEVVEAPEAEMEPAPDNLHARLRKSVPSVCKLPQSLLHVLDLDCVLQVDSKAS
jgi:purine-binding chemotaxis protein CheW